MMKKFFLPVLLIFILSMIYCFTQYGDRWQCRDFLTRMNIEGPDGLKLEYVNIDHKKRSFFCMYNIYDLSNRMEEILSVKSLAENILAECGDIPESYKITIQIGPYGNSVIFSNEVPEEIFYDTDKDYLGGYKLYTARIYVACRLSELIALENVKYLYLEYGMIIDDVEGVRNMNDLISIEMLGNVNKVTEDKTFTEKEQQEIKEMYPGCYISCYPVDTN